MTTSPNANFFLPKGGNNPKEIVAKIYVFLDCSIIFGKIIKSNDNNTTL